VGIELFPGSFWQTSCGFRRRQLALHPR